MDPLADLNRAARALGHDDHEVRVAGQARLADPVDDVPVKIDRLFRHQNGRCARSQTDIECQMARVAAHDLNHGAALVGLHRVTQTIDGLHGRIGGGVVADRVIRADDIVVDGRRDADDRDALLGQLHQTAERAVAADGDDPVQPQQLAGRCGLFLALQRAEFVAAGSVEHGAAAVDDMRNVVILQDGKISVDQAVVAAADADALNAHIRAGADDRADGRVHAGRIAAGSQHTDPFDCICHGIASFQI